ncbi:UDP-N-acetylmuramoyl-L-alanyl-D-glutamate--2,6-diaminopimelate ligase [Alkaliphilus peptidifermentans]|uniref:UDP-N-acetylmuramoyl-L-alanyl-D-glutamate--2,6-diaminopimelate ligase n=1 Tax=Alkaliphilus peptidifermentans DSM 18978 TaxID=1120976 RepID=A0A1G5BF87_9FIRM|nr:UDP-N-acetylmuramoyl-L-alanyl-D-glutamate--2,6-diaminopimelate ligase [Alkaliphilus peptidifermentans]SCX88862.1 UDP-N-acetylmuramoylalanyl-D-glutamate--2,6-diaminopimelate ligase [Alkaliphilus peptidifermentans DSM 18978]
MNLRKLVQKLKIKEVIGNIDLEIHNIHYNSRNIKPGGLFVCIKGFKTDGHLYIKEAIENGAIAILVSQKVMVDGATIIHVDDTRKAMAEVSNVFYGKPSSSLELIGVTGTNGKTSITYMVKKILEHSGRNAGLIGTIATWIDNEKIDAVRTTPEANDLQYLLNRMVDAKLDSCIMEVSSHSLELGRVEGVDFKVGIFTNLTPDHLDFHDNLENYKNAKKKLFYKTSLCNVINVDDAAGKEISDEIKHLNTPILTYGIVEKSDFTACNVKFNSKEVTFNVTGPDNFKIAVKLPIPAIFAVYNALAAIACCYSLKVPADIIAMGLNDFPGVPGRFEVVPDIEEFSVVVDYAHTPDALENLLKSTRDFTTKRIITVFGCGGDRDQSKRPVMGEIAGKYSDITVITSDNPRSEDPMRILYMIEEGIKLTKGNYIVIEDRREAIRYAIKEANKGDIVLIAGKGHEITQVIKDQINVFDDRIVALDVAREEGRK